MSWEKAEIPLFAEGVRGCQLKQLLLNEEKRIDLEARSGERTRIARDLHDTLLQGILSAFLQLHVADERVPADSPAKPLLSRALELMAKGMAECQDALKGLRSPDMAAGTLERAASDLGEELAPEDRARLRIVVLGQPRMLDSNVKAQLYLVTREALINAMRHSGGTKIEIELEYLPNRLRVAVRDDGVGIDAQVLESARDSHWGLVGMRERATSIGAQLRMWSRRGAGTEVEISVPLDTGQLRLDS